MAPTLIVPRDPYAHGIEDTILISVWLAMMCIGILLLFISLTRANLHAQDRRMRDVLFYNLYGRVRLVNLWPRGDGYAHVGREEVREDSEKGEEEEEEEEGSGQGKVVKGWKGEVVNEGEDKGFMVVGVDEKEEEDGQVTENGLAAGEKGSTAIFIVGEDSDAEDSFAL